MNQRPTESIEEWLSTQVGALRKTLTKAILGAWTLAVPLLLSMSGLSTANKIIGSILWVSVTLNLFLFAVVCWHRVERRRHLSTLAKTPELPLLEDSDWSVLRRLVAYDMGCGVRRLADDMGVESYQISFSMDKLDAGGYVVQTRSETLSGPEYKPTPKGRAKIVDPKNNS